MEDYDSSSSNSKEDSMKELFYSEKDDLYDENIDDANDKWLNEKLDSRKSDAVLSCCCCLSILCYDCQKHEFYPNQFRAIFITKDCNVDKNEKYIYNETKLKGQDPLVRISDTSDVSNTEILYAVKCAICKTMAGVMDAETEIIHFFRVLSMNDRLDVLEELSAPDGIFAGNVPDFVKKLFRMLEDRIYDDTIAWSDSGITFLIKDPNEFARIILPQNFKHNNISSFIRQLNKYDFHKIKTSDVVKQQFGEQAWEFQHPRFQRGKVDLLVEVDMAMYIQMLSKNYRVLVSEICDARRVLSAQDQLMQNLLQYLVKQENDKQQIPMGGFRDFDNTPFLKSSAHTFPEIANSSFYQMDEISRRFNKATPGNAEPHVADGRGNPPGLTVYTIGSLQPKKDDSKNIQVTRNTFVPAWSIPPKVLLVEDDAVCRTIGSKLLQVFGCTFDIASDGVDAIQKMNIQRYDIVLMDIVMPNLDGVSATCRIREFDKQTPIISMTSNVRRDDCVKYLANGMNDILPKPFSRESLLAMLDRYCSHLRDKVLSSKSHLERRLEEISSNAPSSSDPATFKFPSLSNIQDNFSFASKFPSISKVTELPDMQQSNNQDRNEPSFLPPFGKRIMNDADKEEIKRKKYDIL
ncbi:hypothetical protein ROZALSC1DRAFT_26906 [Rozella allomycis CSF55]|uniref:Response regulatory domain-containing protein n=1 Tax=Rozella allomycis (strain CSF55) TaxID=988480 RepID=A0A4P9YPY3_ROZAC|nr:hypothetical protein ROZALSC1DRAFT_26906 [Rozella allomycis CSF55]